jgi:hypothetical protein
MISVSSLRHVLECSVYSAAAQVDAKAAVAVPASKRN